MKQILKSVFSYKVIEPTGVTILALVIFDLVARSLTAASTLSNILGVVCSILTILILISYFKDKFWPVAEVEKVEEVKTPEPEVKKPKRKQATKKEK